MLNRLQRPPQLVATAVLTITFCVLAHGRSDSNLTWLAVAPLLGALAAVVVLDVTIRIIPDLITLPGLGYALAWAIAMPGAPGLLNALLGMVVGGGVVFLLAMLTRGGIGGGDIKLMALLGAALGWRAALLVLGFSQLLGVVVGLAIVIARRKRARVGVPVGALMALLGAVILSLRY